MQYNQATSLPNNLTSYFSGGYGPDNSAIPDVTDWDTSSVTNMSFMFEGASNFNQDISGWDTSLVEDMNSMFYGASSFNQDIGGWDISSVIDLGEIFDKSGMSTANFDATLIGWAAQDVQNNLELGAKGLTYSSASAAARDGLVTSSGWTISGASFVNSNPTGSITILSFDFTLEVGGTPSGAFGNKYDSKTDADGKITGMFTVTDASKDLELSLTTFDVDSADELEVLLNGISLGYLDTTANNGEGYDTVRLSSTALVTGENELTIQNKKASYIWGVNEMQIADAFDFML